MPALTIDDLKRIKEKNKAEFVVREGGYRGKITVHMGTCGIAAGAREVMDALLDEMAKAQVDDVIVTNSGCAGLCSREPLATVEIANQAPLKYCDLNGERIREIVRSHVLGGAPLEKYALVRGNETTY
jgi:NADP-reducing hydrogenase subunit HndB